MGLKGLFDKITVSKTVADQTAAEIGNVVESEGYHQADIIEEKRSIPRIDFSKPENFAKYGSAETYYEDSFTYVYSSYPYDGSLREKIEWRNSGSYIDLYLFDNEYPRTNGYIRLSYGGWGSLDGAITSDGYGLPEDLEYISLQGGPHIKSADPQTRTANIWDSDEKRESNLKFNLDNAGSTIEFWLKKQAFDVSKTHKEVIFDLWNNEDTSSADYGRVRLELTGSGHELAGADPFRLTVLSGTTGFTTTSIVPATVTTASVADNAWHHYAVSLANTTTGRSIEFDGAAGAINIGSDDAWDGLVGGAGTNAKSFTLSAWVYANTEGQSNLGSVISFSSADRMIQFVGGDIRFWIFGSITSGYADATLSLNAWHHVVATYTGGSTGTMTLYVDDVSTAAAVTVDTPLAIDGTNCYIGNWDPLNRTWDGYIDEVSVWSHAMSAAEVTELYNGGIPSNLRNHSKAFNLLSWWPMGDNETAYFNGTDISSPSNRVRDIVGGYDGFCEDGALAQSQVTTYSPTNNTVTSKFYLDGKLSQTKLISIGVTALSGTVSNIAGGVEATIGSLITAPNGSSAAAYAGKLSASLDEFRYWKTKRSSKDVGRYWFTQVGGGTNTDVANTDLGVYYKFNEGITEVASTDKIVLDYSGRVTNGTWEGYTEGARSTGSAIVESAASATEFLDPIIYSYNPEVTSKLSELKLSGSAYDFNNPSRLLSYFPSWIQAEDADTGGDELKKLTQIMSSYFDNLYLQVEEFGKIQDIEYVSGSTKPNTLANKLLDSRGILSPELFLDADILEQLGDRSETRVYKKSLNDVKNAIYQNIYNNLINIFKSKGTKKSFRNLLRCFGIDDEIYKLNVYGNNIEYEVRNNRELNSVKKNFIDFNNADRFDSVVFQQTSSTNTNSVSYLSASTNLTGGYATTLESYVLFPDKPEVYEKGFSNSQYSELSASLFGIHTVRPDADGGPNNLTWNRNDKANFQVYAVRDKVGSRDVKFKLTTSLGSDIPTLTSDYYSEVYANTNWVFGVTVKPTKYPLAAPLTGSGVPTYTVEFKGTNVDAGVTLNTFALSSTIDISSTDYGFVTGSKRAFVGAHRTNFTGALLTPTDARVGFLRYWLDDIEPDVIEQHAFDVQNYGTKNPTRSPYLFQDFLAPGPINVEFNQANTLALNWDFETVTTSTAAGVFEVPDFSSGSTNFQATRFGYLGNLLGAQHTGLGYGFPASSTNVVDPDYVIAAELQNFEQLNSKDMISILNDADMIQFTRESRPINFKFAIEKSMYQSISQNMIQMFSVINDFSNIVGEPVHRYRDKYKDLRVLRQQFFERVGNTPDLDKYIEFYKWFDSSLSRLLEQLVPAGADFSDNIRTVVESHILERNKYPFRFSTVEKIPPTFAALVADPVPGTGGGGGVGGCPDGSPPPCDDPPSPACTTDCDALVNDPDLTTTGDGDDDTVAGDVDPSTDIATSGKLPWAPPTGDDCLDDPKSCTSGDPTVDKHLTKIDLSTRVVRSPYRVRVSGRIPLHLGSNFPKKKQVSAVFGYARPWTGVHPGTNAPENIAVAKSSSVQVFREFQRYRRQLPTKDKRLGFGLQSTVNKGHAPEVPGRDFVGDGIIGAPFSMYSGSAAVPSQVATRFRTDVSLTNLHDDLIGNDLCASPQGPFTEKFVGGRQYRHTQLFKTTERPEGWKIDFGGVRSIDAAGFFYDSFAIVPSNYEISSSAPLGAINVPPGFMLREETVKRRVNVANILMTTASLDVRLSGTIKHDRIGNYTKNWQVVQAPSRTANDPYFARQTFSFSTEPETYRILRGRMPFSPNYDPFTSGVPEGTLNFELPNRDRPNSNQTFFVSKFRAPGSYESVSRGWLDPAHEEKSVYNVIPWRNLGVRNYGMSGSNIDPSLATTIRRIDQIDHPRGLRQLLTLHCGIWGLDAIFGDVTQVNPSASFHKVNRNQRPRIKYNTAGDEITGSWFDNGFITHPIPRTEKYYSWVTASLRSGEELYEYSHLSGGYFVQTLPTISGAVDLVYGDFLGLNSVVVDPIRSPIVTDGNITSPNPSTCPNALGLSVAGSTAIAAKLQLSTYYNSTLNLGLSAGYKPPRDPYVTMLNLLLLNRSGPYQWAQFQQRRMQNHPVLRYNRDNNVISVRTKTDYDNEKIDVDGNSITQFIEPVVYSEQKPLVYTMRSTPPDSQTFTAEGTALAAPHLVSHLPVNLRMVHTYGNEIVNYATYELDSLLKTSKPYDSPHLYANRLNQLILKGASTDTRTTSELSNISVAYRQRVYPAAYNAHLSRTFKRERYLINNIWNKSRDKRTDIPLAKGITAVNSQGNSILSQSIWPLDAQYNFTTVQNASGSGELQNLYGTFDKFRGGDNIRPSVTYARRVPVGFDSDGIPMFRGDAEFEMRDARGAAYSVPYTTYEEYCHYLKLVGRDYSLVPEYRSSLYLEEHLLTDMGDFLSLDNIADNFEITGSKYDNSSYTGFFQEYANSDFMKLFKEINDLEGALLVDDTTLSKQTFGLQCTALVKPLPYKGFYPAERFLEMGTLLSKSVGEYVKHYGAYNGDYTQANTKAWRALIDSWSALMGNSIKSGIGVGSGVFTGKYNINPVLPDIAATTWINSGGNRTGQVKDSANNMLPEGVINFGSGSIFSSSALQRSDNWYNFDRIPFDALYDLSHYTSTAISGSGNYQGYFFDSGLGSASLSSSTDGSWTHNALTWDGQRGPLYDLAIDNFLASSLYWFIKPDTRPIFSSVGQSQFNDKEVLPGDKFAMTFHFNRALDGATARAARDKFEMYNRASAFGQPFAIDDGDDTVIVDGAAATGYIQLTSSVSSAGTVATGLIGLTGTLQSAQQTVDGEVLATGSVTIGYGGRNYDGLCSAAATIPEGAHVYITSSLSPKSYLFTFWTGSTATGEPAAGYKVSSLQNKTTGDWIYIATGSSNALAATNLHTAINASGLGTSDGLKARILPARSSLVELTQSGYTYDVTQGFTAINYGHNRVTASGPVGDLNNGIFLEGRLLTGSGGPFQGFGGDFNVYSIRQGDAVTLDGHSCDGIGSLTFTFTESAQTPGGTNTLVELVPGSMSASMLNLVKTVNGHSSVAYELSMSGPRGSSPEWNTTATNFNSVGAATANSYGRIGVTASVSGTCYNNSENAGGIVLSGISQGVGYYNYNLLADGTNMVYTIVDGDYWDISDGGCDGGANTTRFTAKDSPGPQPQFQLVRNNASASANNLKDIINVATNLGVEATMADPAETGNPCNSGQAILRLTNDNNGACGNVAITRAVAAGSAGSNVDGMSGGVTEESTTVYSASLAPWLPSYFYGQSRVDIVCTASYKGDQNLADLLSSADFIYSRDMDYTTYDDTSVGAVMAQQISESFHLNKTSVQVLPTGEIDHVWSIMPKWECPVLNFLDAAPTSPVAATTVLSGGCDDIIVSKGMWHQTGSLTSQRAGITCFIDTPATVVSNKYGTLRNLKSLTDLVGFEEGVVKTLGQVRDVLNVREAIVAVPFVVDKDGRRKFYKLPSNAVALPGLRQNMMDFIFPPTFDFVTHPSVKPVAMYVFEFSTTLDQQDLADIWQNMLPKSWHDPSKIDTFKYQVARALHPIGEGQLLNKTTRRLRSDLRWLVFKVKERAKSNYTSFRDSYLSPNGSEPCETPVPTSQRRRAPYTYNWPNDYLSIVELVKLDEAVYYVPSAPPDDTIAIAGPVSVNIANAAEIAAAQTSPAVFGAATVEVRDQNIVTTTPLPADQALGPEIASSTLKKSGGPSAKQKNPRKMYSKNEGK